MTLWIFASTSLDDELINKDDDRCKREQLFHDQQLSVSHTDLLRPFQADMNG